MIEFLWQYGLFLAKTVTIVAAIIIVVGLAVALSRRERVAERLDVKHLNTKYEVMAQIMRRETLPRKAFKETVKAEKAQKKLEKKQLAREIGKPPRKRVFVLNFHGDIKATAVSSLREEVTAVLTLAAPDDEVLVRLENAGGLVHEHGLAASQLLRIKQRDIPLSIAVDKVAASGGYMMACVGDRILAAPFAIIGSIGVLAQLPNFNRLLDKYGIDFEQVKAGDYKRTLTLFGKNTDEERAKLREEVEHTHTLFKEFIAKHRERVDIEQVATGEHWYGTRALELNLVDELITSDDYLLEASKNADLYEVTYTAKKSVSEKVVSLIHRSSL
jgi:serine protease SohB